MKMRLVLGELGDRDFMYLAFDADSDVHKASAQGDSSMSIALVQLHLNRLMGIPLHIPIHVYTIAPRHVDGITTPVGDTANNDASNSGLNLPHHGHLIAPRIHHRKTLKTGGT